MTYMYIKARNNQEFGASILTKEEEEEIINYELYLFVEDLHFVAYLINLKLKF